MSHVVDRCDRRDDAVTVFAKRSLPPERADRGAMGSAVAGLFRGATIIWGVGRSVAEATSRGHKGLLRAIRERAARQCAGME